jgi:hypothetical protein
MSHRSNAHSETSAQSKMPVELSNHTMSYSSRPCLCAINCIAATVSKFRIVHGVSIEGRHGILSFDEKLMSSRGAAPALYLALLSREIHRVC